MGWLLVTVFVASLLGSLHCVGMCGPFALLASSTDRQRFSAWPIVSYNLGRMLTYTLVGGLFGTLGMALNHITGRYGEQISIWQQTATWFAGALMIAVGLVGLIRFFGMTIQLPSLARPLQRVLQTAFKKIVALSPVRRALLIGMLATLMPCGWLYVFAISAAGTGNPWVGMLLMFAFWAGSVPILVGLMLGTNLFRKVSTRWHKQIPAMMSMLVIATGCFTLAYRAPHAVFAQSKVVTESANVQAQIEQIDHTTLPCCQTEETK
ncbi:MAG TPA: sulfite exporter TauE/SafE family protein [Pirellulaceae bacterium]|nr:sulfite exporter TauE/SafE family protein [Pirellulaceae bacterium]